MARDTKKLLRESFLRLLDERPLHQITIRDIVDECGVNRNTFYYYYRDLPQLMESIVNEAADQVIGQYPSLESADSCLKAACGFAVRRAVLCDLMENELAELPVSGSTVTVPVGNFEIVTLRVTPAV